MRTDVSTLHNSEANQTRVSLSEPVVAGEVDRTHYNTQLLFMKYGRRCSWASRAAGWLTISSCMAELFSKSPSQMQNCSTFSNWWTRKMPHVSLPWAPASFRKQVETPPYLHKRNIGQGETNMNYPGCSRVGPNLAGTGRVGSGNGDGPDL